MMLFTFAKKDGNVVRVGADCSVPAELDAVLKNYSADGYEPADAAEYDAQVIGGAVASSENTEVGAGEVDSATATATATAPVVPPAQLSGTTA